MINKLFRRGDDAAESDKIIAMRESEVSEVKVAMPSTIQVCSRPDELPRYDMVISGTEKNCLVRLSESDAIHIAVIRIKQSEAVIVASCEIFGTKKASRLFAAVRELLQPSKIDVKTAWATPQLVAQLATLRTVATAVDAVELSDTQTETGKESMGRFLDWLRYAHSENASDIHVEIRKDNALVRMRIDGELEVMGGEHDGHYLPKHASNSIALVYNKKSEENSTSATQYNARKSMFSMVEQAIEDMTIRLRCQQIPLTNGLDFVARILKQRPPQQYSELGLLPSQVTLMERKTALSRGLIIVTGITGSGKTTLLKTIMEQMPDRDRKKLATMEDPVEYEIPGVSHSAIPRDVSDAEGSKRLMEETIAGWLRGDIDVLTMGEIRDHASGMAALTIAQTGHLAMGTLHVGSALGIPERLCSPAIGLDLHSITSPDILSLLVCMALVPMLCADCKIPLAEMPLPVQERMKRVGERFGVDTSKMHFNKPGGCACCKYRGRKGMTAVAELVDPDLPMLKLLRNRDEFAAAAYQRTKSDGRFDSDDMTGKTLFDHAFYLALQGTVDPSFAEQWSRYEDFQLYETVQSKDVRAA